ncbi:universal stress protein [Rhizosphaericola mali]|uniref:Universal stress protein n=1 Tax=Rhizosphaericola mali TaxID=2545455 RepID=A0A5P2G2M3_9BACT|nr:universal stress protein [Rhizosphaericola mali]QES89447.1 universal stress protein [Rhizosphaericola mali]
MNTIIVATDYSPEAENAMNYAASAAASIGNYEIILFNLYKLSVHTLNARSNSDFISETNASHQRKLNKASYQLEHAYGVKTTAYLATGDFDDEIEKCIKQYDAMMVVVGMPKKSFEQDLMGNTTTKMLHMAKIPTLAVPLDVKYTPIKNILFACDIMRGVHKMILRQVQAVAKLFHAEVELFYVSEKLNELSHQEKADAAVQKLRKNNDLDFVYKNVESSEIIEAISAEIDEFHADVLVMVPYKYGFWNSIVHRSKTREMASGNKIPLFSIPL